MDNTITASAAMRVEGYRKYSTDATGDANLFANAGDVYATPVSLLTDFGLSKGNFGFFTRFAYVYDHTIMGKDCTNCERPNTWPNANGSAYGGDPNTSVFQFPATNPVEKANGISDASQNLAGNRFNILDLFVYGGWDIADHPLNVRVGKQVINWGESNIQGGGISQMMNPRDLSKATTPGTDVKETLIPQESIYFNFGFTDNVSLEAYYTWNWRESTFIAAGTYFSPFDQLGTGYNPDLLLRGIEKWGNNEEPKDNGQWGINMHFVIPSWNYADLGIYWVRSHGFVPWTQFVEDYTPRPDPANPGSNTVGGYEWAYGEDADTYAISLNGEGPFDTSFAMEVNMKQNAGDVRECRNVFGISEAGIPGLGGLTVGAANGFPDDPRPVFGPGASDAISECDGPGSEGAELGTSDVYVFLGNLTKSGGTNFMGASKLSLVMDVSASWVTDLDSRQIWDRYNIPGKPTTGSRPGSQAENPGRFPGVGPLDTPVTEFAWGYTAVAALEYPNVFWNLTVKPTFIFVHNVEGYAPGTGGGMIENQRTMVYKLGFDYQGQQSLDLTYTNWLGTAGGSYDKDFVSVVYKYSF